jgi:negative regulator of sigma E activity
MEELLKPEMVEAIIMSATVGQFGQQLCEETWNEAWKKFDAAKAQLINTAVSGGSALTTYLLTQDTFNPKAAAIALISGIFATTALKMLKKKNSGSEEKAAESAAKLKELELQAKEDRIAYLEKELKIKVELLHAKNDLIAELTPDPK